ncbi:hypothetical protein SSX86_011436 [Deinandra increscens subsp. villosa]|uniref:HMA domain-containing protein n=1 Tax=Deinandra increscens subsp. villosa TaxID=3103831 RepID=A0AAP0DB36_9ASTR
MEGTLSAATTPLFFSKTLRFSTVAAQICRSQLPLLRSPRIAIITNALLFQTSAPSALSPVWCRRHCVSSSAASSASSGVDDVSPSSSDLIILDVRGMMCGGCESSVKRILENQSQVLSASVDHTTETATVWPISEAKLTPNWQKVIGEELAKNLTNCGFDSNLRGVAGTEGESS